MAKATDLDITRNYLDEDKYELLVKEIAPTRDLISEVLWEGHRVDDIRQTSLFTRHLRAIHLRNLAIPNAAPTYLVPSREVIIKNAEWSKIIEFPTLDTSDVAHIRE